MPGVGHVGRARAALQKSQRRPAPAPRVRANPCDPLPLSGLPLAPPPEQWLVPLARAAALPRPHPAGISSVFGWRASNQSAVATLHRLASEPRPGCLTVSERGTERSALRVPGADETDSGFGCQRRS